MYKVLLATGTPQLEEAIKRSMETSNGKATYVGYVTMKDDVMSKISQTGANVVIISSALQGNKKDLDLIFDIKKYFKDTRIVYLSGDTGNDKSLQTALVTYNVFDFITSNTWRLNEIVDLILNPRSFADVQNFVPNLKADGSLNNVQVKTAEKSETTSSFNKNGVEQKGELTDLLKRDEETRIDVKLAKEAHSNTIYERGQRIGFVPTLVKPANPLNSSSRPRRQQEEGIALPSINTENIPEMPQKADFVKKESYSFENDDTMISDDEIMRQLDEEEDEEDSVAYNEEQDTNDEIQEEQESEIKDEAIHDSLDNPEEIQKENLKNEESNNSSFDDEDEEEIIEDESTQISEPLEDKVANIKEKESEEANLQNNISPEILKKTVVDILKDMSRDELASLLGVKTESNKEQEKAKGIKNLEVSENLINEINKEEKVKNTEVKVDDEEDMFTCSVDAKGRLINNKKLNDVLKTSEDSAKKLENVLSHKKEEKKQEVKEEIVKKEENELISNKKYFFFLKPNISFSQTALNLAYYLSLNKKVRTLYISYGEYSFLNMTETKKVFDKLPTTKKAHVHELSISKKTPSKGHVDTVSVDSMEDLKEVLNTNKGSYNHIIVECNLDKDTSTKYASLIREINDEEKEVYMIVPQDQLFLDYICKEYMRYFIDINIKAVLENAGLSVISYKKVGSKLGTKCIRVYDELLMLGNHYGNKTLYISKPDMEEFTRIYGDLIRDVSINKEPQDKLKPEVE